MRTLVALLLFLAVAIVPSPAGAEGEVCVLDRVEVADWVCASVHKDEFCETGDIVCVCVRRYEEYGERAEGVCTAQGVEVSTLPGGEP